MSERKLVKFVERLSVVGAKEARKAGLKPKRWDAGVLEDGSVFFTMDVDERSKRLH